LALPKVQFESRDEYPAARWLLDLLTQEAVFFDPDWNALRMASSPGQPSTLLPDARNLPWLAFELKKQHLELFNAWKEHVHIGLPQVTDIDVVEREEDHHAYFRVTYQHGYVVTSSGLSEGTLRVLALTLPAYLPVPPRFLAVEEPENGIHPRAIEAVLEALSSVRDSQVLLSSHSPIVVVHTELTNLITARLLRSGAVEIVPGSKHPRLAEWKGAIDLGTLFAAGVLG
jgi:predicted ATPase